MSNRHRASGDALATVQLFKLLLEKDQDKSIIQQTVKYFDRRGLKDKLNAILDTIPEKMGVFYVHDENGNVIYIGRNKNLKSEVNRLFLKESKRAQKIHERVQSVTYELTCNELFTRLRYNIELETLQPKYNFSKKKKLNLENFAHSDFIIQHKGREVEENAIILVENNEVTGYGFTNLSFQESQLEVLKSILTPTDNKELAKSIVKNYMKNNSVSKIIRF
jgi:DNA polymerase-3 subunit epsilon